MARVGEGSKGERRGVRSGSGLSWSSMREIKGTERRERK